MEEKKEEVERAERAEGVEGVERGWDLANKKYPLCFWAMLWF